MALLGIDIGSTGCACAVFAADGRLLAKRYREYDRPAGASEFDGMAIWELLSAMIPESGREAGEGVNALAVASIGEAVAPIDADGVPLEPFLQSTSPKGDPYIDDLRRLVGDRVRRVTGLSPLARYSLAKLQYFRRERPDAFRSAWKFMMLEDFVVFRLTGVAASDYTVASRTAAFNLAERRYDPEILAAVGLEPDRFCPVHPPGTAVGAVTTDAAGRLGLPPGIPVVLGGHDIVPEHLASGLFRTGGASAGLGTFESLAVLVPEKPGPDEGFLANNFSREPYPLADLEIVMGVNPNAGGLVKWFRDEFGGLEKAAAGPGGNAFRLLDESAPAEPTGILVVPHLAGSGVPEFNRAARGTITGLILAHGRGHLYRAFLEGIAYEMAFMVEKYRECGVAIADLTAGSGGARSRFWLQIRADVLGIPVTPMRNPDTTVGGCAMLAGTASGVYRDLEAAARAFVKKGGPVVPDPARHAHYLEMLEKYRRARAMFMEFWSR